MSRTRIIPVLLLKNGGLYKTIKFKSATYVGDPINTVKIFNEKEADELVVLDFNASAENRAIDLKKIAEIAGEAFMPMAYGGGIKSMDDARKVFDAGYEKVVLNSILFDKPDIIESIGSVYGAQAIVAAIDVKKNFLGKYKVYSHSGTKSTGYSPVEWARKLEGAGAGEILVNSIDQDGTWAGYNVDLVESIAHQINIPLIACGGAGNTEDLKNAVAAGASAVAAGSMFVYQKKGMGVLISFPTGLKI
ncbi:AglZ/HisF2 family acetamidino modification protein [Paraflavitalea sp. CAU 1676]|uniref:AglZ/HisF2 family acetamidino modification protein n=1 Tax=Paraflavitalea sp. CAU 1676 TaxID=3032598 RepID=UPI0023DC69E7|nr:AglZ/HisF2 family acetamidino modification protein [Paraflavitalea sp. CAU 1676]MDF2187064.1 AglZ/HisF2 family acetamidino modification protein [Paraflavitalea sp. CAU 1676]